MNVSMRAAIAVPKLSERAMMRPRISRPVVNRTVSSVTEYTRFNIHFSMFEDWSRSVVSAVKDLNTQCNSRNTCTHAQSAARHPHDTRCHERPQKV